MAAAVAAMPLVLVESGPHVAGGSVTSSSVAGVWYWGAVVSPRAAMVVGSEVPAIQLTTVVRMSELVRHKTPAMRSVVQDETLPQLHSASICTLKSSNPDQLSALAAEH